MDSVSTAEERRQKLFDSKVETAAVWSPEKFDDFIMGQILEVKSSDTKYGRRMSVTIRADMCTSEGNPQEKGLYIVWERTHLKQLWIRNRICVGDYVGMQYAIDGEKKKGANPAKLFKMTLEKTDESQPWFDPENDVPKVPDNVQQAPTTDDQPPLPDGDDVPF